MPSIVSEVQTAGPAKATMGECPHCTERVAGFQIGAPLCDDDEVVITVMPCGCASHSTDGDYKQFVELVKASESLV